MKFRKLDGRFSGYKDFKYSVDFLEREIELFCKVREWCWQQWGPGVELDSWYKIPNPNTRWCWQRSEWKTRIYLATDAEYQWFLLKYT